MTRVHMLSPTVVAVVVAIGCGGGKPQPASATTEAAPEVRPIQMAQASDGASGGSASITGSITFEGTAPQREAVKMSADPVCNQQHKEPVRTEEVVVNSNGTLKNVFVYAKEGVSGTYPPPATPVKLDQAGCWYMPHVGGIQVDQPLEIVNSDPTLHNVNAKPAANPPFNVAQPVKGMKTTKKFTKPEVMVKFKCNVHPWMSAYLGVLPHPFFAVSGEDGAFTISGLPAGSYVIEAWHEKYGAQTQNVTVGDGERKSVTFTFKGQ